MEQKSLKQAFVFVKERFLSGEIDLYAYLSERHEFNKLLLEYATQIKDSMIESIKILPGSVVFTFKPLGIEMETEGAARSAPFEILNFGRYEPEDEVVTYRLIQEGDTILDIGANIGWYTINLAKRFPRAEIYSFEPVSPTYELLTKNVQRNRLPNVTLLNFGLSDKEETKDLYYFRGGSSIASIINFADNPKAQKIPCRFRSLDKVVAESNLKAVNFIKCDVEGSELLVLRGGEKTITRFNPILLLEVYEGQCQRCGYTAMDLVNLLKSWGYEYFEASNGQLNRIGSLRSIDNGRYNYFFLHTEAHKNLIDKLQPADLSLKS